MPGVITLCNNKQCREWQQSFSLLGEIIDCSNCESALIMHVALWESQYKHRQSQTAYIYGSQPQSVVNYILALGIQIIYRNI